MSNQRKKSAGSITDPLFGSWNDRATAPRDVVILGFFEDIGWHACAWSDLDECWKLARCTSEFPLVNVPDDALRGHAEPEWSTRSEHDDDLCWWMPMPPSRHPRHDLPNSKDSQP